MLPLRACSDTWKMSQQCRVLHSKILGLQVYCAARFCIPCRHPDTKKTYWTVLSSGWGMQIRVMWCFYSSNHHVSVDRSPKHGIWSDSFDLSLSSIMHQHTNADAFNKQRFTTAKLKTTGREAENEKPLKISDEAHQTNIPGGYGQSLDIKKIIQADLWRAFYSCCSGT